MANIEMLKSKIKDSGMTITAICQKADITKRTFYNRLKKPDFTIAEALALKDTLHMTNEELEQIFLQ